MSYLAEQKTYEQASFIVLDPSVEQRVAKARDLPLVPSEAAHAGSLAAMNSPDIRALLMGRTRDWLVKTGDPIAGVGVARALAEFWRIGGRHAPGTGIDRLIEFGDALCAMAAGYQRAGRGEDALKTVRVHLSELGSTPQATRMKLIAADIHIERGELDDAETWLGEVPPTRDDLAIEWRRLRARLGVDDGTEPESTAQQWNRVLDGLQQLMEMAAPLAGASPQVIETLRARIAQERRNVPPDDQLLDRLNRLREVLGGLVRPLDGKSA